MLFSLFCSVVKNGKLESVTFYHEFHCIHGLGRQC